jgi:DedD protein
MDESLKARLIGATVLVAVAVILVPELLSGRGPAHAAAPDEASPGTRKSVIVLSPGGAAQPAVPVESAPGPLPAPTLPVQESTLDALPGGLPEPAATLADTNPAPVAAGVTPAAAKPDTPPTAAPTPTPAPAAATPPPATRPAPPPPAAVRGAWAVQVGAFGSTSAADKVVGELRAAGFRAYVSPVQRSGKTLYRVRVGPEPERARADALATTLKGRGLPATVVAND